VTSHNVDNSTIGTAARRRARRGAPVSPVRAVHSDSSERPLRFERREVTIPLLSDKPVYRRATYYLRPEQIKALKLRAVMEERDLSSLVREAIDRFLAIGHGDGKRRAA